MIITIDLTKLSNDEVRELTSLLYNSINYNDETKETQSNYKAVQKIELFMLSIKYICSVAGKGYCPHELKSGECSYDHNCINKIKK